MKYNILKYLPDTITVEQTVNPLRIYDFNNKHIKKGKIVYLMEREYRIFDNFALQFAENISIKYDLRPEVICKNLKFDYISKQDFINQQIDELSKSADEKGLNLKITDDIEEYLKNEEIAALIIDFNPILNRSYLKKFDFKIYEVDGHNVIPARYISDKQEYNARTFRKKVYSNIYPFFTEYKSTDINYPVIDEFITKKLNYYAEFKNNPNKDVLSGFSKYLNFGFISPQRVAIEIIKSNAPDTDKEIFLEELITRRELADNFCLHNNNFLNLNGIPNWAKISINSHKSDLRDYIYSLEQLEHSKTHDKLWNSAQLQLLKEGVIHGYIRMYWAKKIMEWSTSAKTAQKYAIYLNDKYAFDSPSPSGYVNILWAIGGLHDRAFKDWKITGKIRRMTYNSLKNKFSIEKYIDKINKL